MLWSLIINKMLMVTVKTLINVKQTPYTDCHIGGNRKW